jgi:7,8-dihydroneopterin aldolase/epimerase/oxygenase
MEVEDLISIRGLRLTAWIGVPAEERAEPQTLVADIHLTPSRPLTGLGDEIAHTIDYDAVSRHVRTLAATARRRLLESLAEDIITSLFAWQPEISGIEVCLRKHIIPGTDSVEVRLRRRRTPSQSAPAA